MSIEQMESAIESRLKNLALVTDLADVVLLPDAVADYRTPTSRGLITVHYVGEKHDQNQSIGEPSQHLTLTFGVSIQSRFLRGQRGVYAIAEAVKSALMGYHLPDCGPLVCEEQQFAGYQNDIWEHLITFSVRTLRTTTDQSLLPSDDVTLGDEVYFTQITIKE